MKRIVFMIIATLLVLGLVLPGCGATSTPPRDRPLVTGQISIAVTGAISDITGLNAWRGATLAAQLINATGISLNATPHYVKLVQVDTNEVQGLPDEGVTALQAVINSVDFVVGGFRTESVSAYRTVAMSAKVIMFNCGAATLRLQRSVNENYPTYKYWFKATPYNEIFLVTSMLKMVASAAGSLIGTMVYYNLTLGKTWIDPAYYPGFPPPAGAGSTLRVVIVGEALEWDDKLITIAQQKLPTLLSKKGINMTVVATYKWSDKATETDIATDMATIAGLKPHIIFTSFSGPVGKSYSKTRASLGIPALSVGINVEGQQQGMLNFTSDGCLYDMMLDTYAWGCNETSLMAPFFNAYWGNFTPSDYPTYTAATYDALYALKDAIETTSSMDPALLIGRIETAQRTVTGAAKSAVYPSGTQYLGLTGSPPVKTWSLNSTQVLQLYPFLNSTSVNGTTWGIVPGSENFTDVLNWTYYYNLWTTSGGFTAHDTVYGPAYQTGLGVQWQNLSGTIRKMCWWPNVPTGAPNATAFLPNPNNIISLFNATTQANLWWLGVLDQYGYWAFQYPGTVAVVIPALWWFNP